jgi:hypothetical protein
MISLNPTEIALASGFVLLAIVVIIDGIRFRRINRQLRASRTRLAKARAMGKPVPGPQWHAAPKAHRRPGKTSYKEGLERVRWLVGDRQELYKMHTDKLREIVSESLGE